MTEVHDERPDGQVATPETLKLRRATRALRLHLDELPIDYHLDISGDRFLAGLAFMSARQRYACADSMIGAGFGGSVIGAIARSLFVDGLQWLWIGELPERRRALLGDLLEERNGLCILLEDTGASCANLARWLMPLPDVADLTGESLSWLDAPAMPVEQELIDEFLARRTENVSVIGDTGEHEELLRRTRTLLDMSGLLGAVMVLAHAGHGNYLGLSSSVTEHGAAGHDLRADHEALFMQVAAAGATAALLGNAAAVPELWPSDVPRQPFLARAVELTADVASAAVPIHRLDTARRPLPQGKKKNSPQRRTALLRPSAVLGTDDLMPDILSIDRVAKAAEGYHRLTRSLMIRPWDYGEPTLHAMLAYGGGHSNLAAVMNTYDQPGAGVIAVFAARMLLEEAARMVWRYSTGAIQEEFEERAKQYFDEFRARQKKTIDTLRGSGVPKADAQRIFARPSNIRIDTPIDEIAKNRKPIPKIGEMLKALGTNFPEPGWLEVAYSLLSQITHSTPIGQLHTVRFRNGIWHGNELSPEMLALTLDVACIGSAHIIGMGARLLSNDAVDAADYHRRLLRQAITVVHSRARMVHGLD
ncbi:hypothetical protein SAMN05216553_12134 [Lentzea fradiae]|uniref:Uncharacterized protein n=1 Tax=Lentzea fradiae TaxID=200378 RepID=A0A1G8C632_9PSEU|nr:hypothetical protein [Lentzea fradiae]SDH40987.1 hypothetical protein SAMN05216553_12134 [Lentzea fradiae]